MNIKKKNFSIATLLQVSAILTSIPGTIYGMDLLEFEVGPFYGFQDLHDLDAVLPLVPILEENGSESTDGVDGEQPIQKKRRSKRIEEKQKNKAQNENQNLQNIVKQPSTETSKPKQEKKVSTPKRNNQVAMPDPQHYGFKSIWSELVVASLEDAKVLEELFPEVISSSYQILPGYGPYPEELKDLEILK